ncbi:DNA primase, partial [Pectobacterium versatile]
EHRGQVIEYIEVERSDIVLANQLAHDILGRTLDEMPPQTRKLLLLIQQWVKESGQPKAELHFTRKQLRDAVQWGDTQLKIHLARLAELEYLMLHKRGLTFCYELLFDGDTQADNAHLCGLIDVLEAPTSSATTDNNSQYDSAQSGVSEKRSASGRGAVGSWSGKLTTAKARTGKGSASSGRVSGKSAVPATHDKPIVP